MLAAIVGIPISAIAYGFLALVAAIQQFLFTELPNQLLGNGAPAWWPVPWLVLCGLLTALVIRYLPGNGGLRVRLSNRRRPAHARQLPGIALAALTTLSLGAVLGPEAPLIAIGGGLAALTVSLSKKDAPPIALMIMTSAGSFAAISTLLGPCTGRVLDHGGRRDQWDDAQPGSAAGPARFGNRGVGLRWSGQLDRSRQLFARAAVSSARGAADVGHPGGRWPWGWRVPCWGG